MSFGDSITIVHDGDNIVMNRINQDNYASEYYYRSATDTFRMRIRHSQVNAGTSPSRDRHNVELTRTVFATTETDEYSEKVYAVMEMLPSQANILLAGALTDWLNASTKAALTKLIGWES